MLKFFRKIRQRLITDHKFSKYLLYAIGEIVLVVIGILIALQINNWNQNRVNEIEEKRILTAISEELKLNKFLFYTGTGIQENKFLAAKSLLEEMQVKKEQPNNASIDKNIGMLTKRWLSGTPTSIYDALIGSGDLKLISSGELRFELAQLKSDQEFLRLLEEIQIKFEDDHLSPFLNEHINRSEVRLSSKPELNDDPRISDIPTTPFKSSYTLLLENKEFANLLVEFLEHTSRVIGNYDRLERVVEIVDSLTYIGNNRVESVYIPH